MKVAMITTSDNPFDPFDEFDEWLAFDEEKNNLCHQYFGCSSCQMLDKKSFASSNMFPAYANDENERAIDEICDAYSMFGIFKKVTREIKDKTS